jgi:beta-glucanase (GH16 family)
MPITVNQNLDTNGTAQLSFDDEFNGSSIDFWNATSNQGTWDTGWAWSPYDSVNTTQYGQLHYGQEEAYVNNNYGGWNASQAPWTLDGQGDLQITASHFAPGSIPNTPSGTDYLSGAINSYHSYAQKYGYFEIKATLTDAPGSWPAFWLLAEGGTYPTQPPEIDAFEILGNNGQGLDATKDNFGTWVYDGQNSIHEEHPTDQSDPATIPDAASGSHLYGVDWEPDKITFYFDRQPIGSMPTPSDLTGVSSPPMYLIANLAMGGGWGGQTDGQDTSIKIDYIRAYQATDQNNGYVYTGDASYTAPATGVSHIILQSPSAQDVTGNNLGDVIGRAGSGADPGSAQGHEAILPNGAGTPDATIHGGAGNDTIYIAKGALYDVSGGGGHDTFVMPDIEGWDASTQKATIEDFSTTTDLFNVAARDGAIHLVADPDGVSTDIMEDFNQTTYLQAVIKNVLPTQLTTINNGDAIVGTSYDGGGSSWQTDKPTDTAPAGVTDITLTGSGQTVYGNDQGDTFHSNNTGNHLIGGAGADTFILGRGGDVATGNGGADTFTYNEVPWAPGAITDFNGGEGDRIDLQGLLGTMTNYQPGSDPFANGFLQYVTDSSGNVVLQANYQVSGNDGWWTVATLDNVTNPSTLSYHDGWIT